MRSWVVNIACGCIAVSAFTGSAVADDVCATAGASAAVPQPMIGPAALPGSWGAPSAQATATATVDGAVAISLRSGAEPYPGAVLAPANGTWNLSNFNEVVARLTNTGTVPVTAGLRVDDANSEKSGKWNDESAVIRPGETRTVALRFGRSKGQDTASIDRAAVARVVLFAPVNGAPASLRIDSLTAAGAASLSTGAPRHDRLASGVILGDAPCLDRTVQAIAIGGARVELMTSGSQRRLQFKGNGQGAGVVLQPVTGYWDLRDYLEVQVKVHNSGTTVASISGRLESAEGNTAWNPAVSVAPGASSTLVLPFAASQPVVLTDTPPPKYASDEMTAIALKVDGSGERDISVEEVRAAMPPPQRLPDWVGHRPPVPGDWKMTLNEDFDGNAIDDSRWSVTGTNYWEKLSHFSKQNVTVVDGKANLRFEHKRGHANDDPAQPETDYTTGYLSSVGKWSQRYGYFEARVKLPHAPGLWPAVWMMPDRGAEAPDRFSTLNGGMEFDFIEYLTRFGPNRYNVGLHWDGYTTQHKTTDDDGTYVQPDADGFVIAGMLWEPGSVTFYANGKEVAKRTDPRVGSVASYLIVTLIGGGWGGNDVTGESLPDQLQVDWIRAWQRSGR